MRRKRRLGLRPACTIAWQRGRRGRGDFVRIRPMNFLVAGVGCSVVWEVLRQGLPSMREIGGVLDGTKIGTAQPGPAGKARQTATTALQWKRCDAPIGGRLTHGQLHANFESERKPQCRVRNAKIAFC